jgi:hypothetical protein
MPVWVVGQDYVRKQSKPFERLAWFGDLDDRSYLYGNYRDLYNDGRVRGVRLASSEAGAQKSYGAGKGELYTAGNLREALNIAGITGGVEKLVFESLQRKK